MFGWLTVEENVLVALEWRGGGGGLMADLVAIHFGWSGRGDNIATRSQYVIAAALVALLAPLFLVYPTNGAITTVKGFEIIVIGGLGSIPGALIGGVLLGLPIGRCL